MKRILVFLLVLIASLTLVACGNDEPTLKSIAISGQDTEFMVGEEFSYGDLKVTATMSDESTVDVTNDVTVTQQADMNTPGSYVVIISYEGQVATYQIKVSAQAYVESIAISGQKTEFTVGDAFDKDELKVIATMSDKSTADVTAAAQVSQNADMNTAGSYAVVVSYEGKVATYQINVVAKENVATLKAVDISIAEAKVEYLLGEELLLSGVQVFETYSNTTCADTIKVADLTEYTVKVVNDASEQVVGAFADLGKYTVTLTKGEFSVSYEVEVYAEAYATVKEAVEAGVANASKVLSGTVIVDNFGYVENFEYEFGKNYTYVNDSYSETYYQALDDETVFGIQVSEGWDGSTQLSPAYEPTANNLKGVDLQSALAYQYEIFGVEGLVETLYAIAQEETSYNFKEEFKSVCIYCGNANVYSYAFEVIISEYYYYYVNVEFTLDVKNNNFDEVNVNMYGYYLDSMVKDEEAGTYAPADLTAPYDFECTIKAVQVVGERTAENPYEPSQYIFESFDLQDAEGNAVAEEQEFDVIVSTPLTINVVNINPTTANAEIDNINVIVTDENGFETYSVYGSYYDGVITITAYKVGKYNVEIASSKVSKNISMNVEFAELTSISAAVYDEMSWGLVEQSEATVYTGNSLSFAAVANENADASVDAALKEASENASIEFDGTYYVFTATAAGTYEVVLTSKVNSALTATLTITVEEAPSLGEVLNGTYEFNSMMLGTATYVFTPSAEGALNGTLTISVTGGYAGEQAGTFNYTYYDSLSYLEVLPADEASQSCQFSVAFDSSYNLVCMYNGWEQGPLTKVESSGNETGIEGTYSTVYTHMMTGMANTMELVFNADGTGSYSLMNGGYTGTFAYAVAEGVITFSDVVATFGTEVALTATVTETGINCTTQFVADGNSLTLDYTGASSESETTSNPVVGESKVEATYWGSAYTFTAEEAGTYTFSVDETVAILLINDGYSASGSVTLEAGATYEVVVMTQTNDGTQVVTLTITKA